MVNVATVVSTDR